MDEGSSRLRRRSARELQKLSRGLRSLAGVGATGDHRPFRSDECPNKIPFGENSDELTFVDDW